MSFVVLHWRYIAIAALAGTTALFYALWNSSANGFAEYRARVAAIGEQRAAETKRVNEQHETTLEVVSNAWNDQLPAIRKNAVANYIATSRGGLLTPADRCALSVNATSPKSPDAPPAECVPPEQFISGCAEDAGKVMAWQEWARLNDLPVR